MKVEKKEIEKSQLELTVTLELEEFKNYFQKGAKSVSKEIKIDGFRKGKVPYEILKNKIGEMAILEESARIAINETIEKAIQENRGDKQPVGQPQINITKIAPDNPLEYKITTAFLPKVTLDTYKNLKIKRERNEVETTEINKIIENILESRAKEKLVDREAKKNDKVIIDINMLLDKVAIDGGQSKNTTILIGKNYIIPGFDEKLLGAKKGEKIKFKLPYPKDHYMKNIAGKNVDFEIKINGVYEREIPELDDTLAKELGAKDKKDLESKIKEDLIAQKENENKKKSEIKIFDAIMKKTKFGEIPEILINIENQNMMKEMEQEITSKGGKFEDYLSSINKTREQMMLDLVPNALKRVKSALIIREIAKLEKISISEKEVDERIEQMLKQYKGYQKVESHIKNPEYKNHLEGIMINDKIISKLLEWNLVS